MRLSRTIELPRIPCGIPDCYGHVHGWGVCAFHLTTWMFFGCPLATERKH